MYVGDSKGERKRERECFPPSDLLGVVHFFHDGSGKLTVLCHEFAKSTFRLTLLLSSDRCRDNAVSVAFFLFSSPASRAGFDRLSKSLICIGARRNPATCDTHQTTKKRRFAGGLPPQVEQCCGLQGYLVLRNCLLLGPYSRPMSRVLGRL